MSSLPMLVSLSPMCETVRRQRPWDRLGGLNKRGFLAHLNPRGIEDETEHQSPESIGREGCEGHPAGDSSAVRRRREDPDRFWRACGGEDSIAELCRREGISQNLYYRWSKDFLEAGKKRLAGDTAREVSVVR